jgi:hypothetical protein
MAFAENNTGGSLWARGLLDIVYKAKALYSNNLSIFLVPNIRLGMPVATLRTAKLLRFLNRVWEPETRNGNQNTLPLPLLMILIRNPTKGML